MTIINERKLNDLDRNVFTIKVITTLSRFFVTTVQLEEIRGRYDFIKEMHDSLEKYQLLYDTTENSEYKNLLENNYDSAVQSLEEQKQELYDIYPLSSLLFLDNVKKQFRDGFYNEMVLITNQFSTAIDLSEYICYHGSLDLNIILNEVLNRNISDNYRKLFEQIKSERIVSYKKEDWINVSSKLNSCLIEIKMNNQYDQMIDKYICKLIAYRFLLTVFNYGF